MNRKKIFLITLIASFITLNVYLFVSAPTSLSNKKKSEDLVYSSSDLFKVLASVNDNARSMYTKHIVQTGLG